MAPCPSVCLSVTSRYCITTVERRITRTKPCVSTGILVSGNFVQTLEFENFAKISTDRARGAVRLRQQGFLFRRSEERLVYIYVYSIFDMTYRPTLKNLIVSLWSVASVKKTPNSSMFFLSSVHSVREMCVLVRYLLRISDCIIIIHFGRNSRCVLSVNGRTIPTHFAL